MFLPVADRIVSGTCLLYDCAYGKRIMTNNPHSRFLSEQKVNSSWNSPFTA